MRRFGRGAGLILCAWAANAQAQVAPPAPESLSVGDWAVTPVLEARVRGEYRHDVDAQDHGFLTERARAGVDVARGPVEARVVLQDVRVWDLAAGSDSAWEPGAQALFGMYEAWGEARTAALHPAFVRVGRQPVTWGEGRLLGVADWSPAGRTLDAVRARLPIGDGALEALAASLSEASGASGASGAALTAWGELFGARFEWAYHPLFAVEAYALARLAQAAQVDPAVQGQTYTGALRLHGDGAAWNWGIEGAYQLGHADNVRGGVDRGAWAAAAHVTHTFERVVLTPSVGASASYASGDDGGSKYATFDPILPDVHAWHGAMDLFAWSNQAEVGGRVAVAPWADGTAAVAYRYARLAQPGDAWRSDYLLVVGRVPGNTSAALGHEIDAVVSWAPWTSVELTAGYSVLFLGDGARAIVEGSAGGRAPGASHYAYLQGTIRLF